MEAHAEGLLTAFGAVLAALGVPGIAAWLIKRAGTSADHREALIEALRKALDKGRVRENAYCGALDALVAGIDALPDPPPALVAARARALERMESAHCQLRGAS